VQAPGIFVPPPTLRGSGRRSDILGLDQPQHHHPLQPPQQQQQQQQLHSQGTSPSMSFITRTRGNTSLLSGGSVDASAEAHDLSSFGVSTIDGNVSVQHSQQTRGGQGPSEYLDIIQADSQRFDDISTDAAGFHGPGHTPQQQRRQPTHQGEMLQDGEYYEYDEEASQIGDVDEDAELALAIAMSRNEVLHEGDANREVGGEEEPTLSNEDGFGEGEVTAFDDQGEVVMEGYQVGAVYELADGFYIVGEDGQLHKATPEQEEEIRQQMEASDM